LERIQKGTLIECDAPCLRLGASGRGSSATAAVDNLGERQINQQHARSISDVIGVLPWVLPAPEEFGP
jgi:hypothetical protein